MAIGQALSEIKPVKSRAQAPHSREQEDFSSWEGPFQVYQQTCNISLLLFNFFSHLNWRRKSRGSYAGSVGWEENSILLHGWS
jgi:hypothetical protein